MPAKASAWAMHDLRPLSLASQLLHDELTPKSWTQILTFGVFPMGKYSVQFKITAVEAYINGDDGFRK
ncbi:hypothetical protein, partial [Pseudomonas fluorescens]|uniref:hypothetical protein n=1 Tax=Pseudomonas fluorescens TaxID=294 RepID=UPI001CD34CDC